MTQAEYIAGVLKRRQKHKATAARKAAEGHGRKCVKLLTEGLTVGEWLGRQCGIPERRRALVLEHAALEAEKAARFANRALDHSGAVCGGE